MLGLDRLLFLEPEGKVGYRWGWAEMIRKVYEVDPMICPRCGGRIKVISFLTEYAVVDRIIRHLKLEFLTPFCSREYHHFVRAGAYFGPDGSELSDAQKRNFPSLIRRLPAPPR